MYATEILMPTMNADLGPYVFGAEKIVEPRMWMVHYKGQVAPPTDGTYRFLGDADDFTAVAVNGVTVLVADIPGTRLQRQVVRQGTGGATRPVATVAGSPPEIGSNCGPDSPSTWTSSSASRPADKRVVRSRSRREAWTTTARCSRSQLSANANTPVGGAVWKGVQ